MIKGILFDLDDTLYDHSYSCRNGLTAVQKEFSCFGIYSLDEFEKEHIKLLNEVHLSQVLTGKLSIDEARIERFRRAFDKIGYKYSSHDCERAAMIYRKNYELVRKVVPGSIELLDLLLRKFKLAVISNNLLDEQTGKMKQLGLDKYFDIVVVSEKVKYIKPEPEIFFHAINKMDCKPGETVMIGDSWESDIIGAYNSGLKAIWFNRFNLPIPDRSIAGEINSFIPASNVLEMIK